MLAGMGITDASGGGRGRGRGGRGRRGRGRGYILISGIISQTIFVHYFSQ
jgi:hypothetical protein